MNSSENKLLGMFKIFKILSSKSAKVENTCQPEVKIDSGRLDSRKNEEVLDRSKNETDKSIKNAGKLFVGGLNLSTTSLDFETYFSRFGNVADAVIIKYPSSGKSRGFGFVTFVDPANAEKVLQTKRHEIDGKIVEVRYFDSSPPKANHQNRVFIENLSENIEKDDLAEFFRRYGEITDIVIPRDKETNQKKPFGFISFKDKSSEEHCVADGFLFLKGKKLLMKKATPRECSLKCDDFNVSSGSNANVSEDVGVVEILDEDENAKNTEFSDGRKQTNDPAGVTQVEKKSRNKRKLFVGGLNLSTTSQSLKTYFSRFGKIADAVIIKYPSSGKSRGFGFVTFVDPANAEKVLQTKRHEIDGKIVEVRYFDSSPPKANHQNRVYIENLSENIEEDDLAEFFRRYGEITDIVIPRDKETNQKKPFGFISFKDKSSEEHCVADGFLFLKGKKLLMKKATPRECSLKCDDFNVSSGSNANVSEDVGVVEILDEDENAKNTEFSEDDMYKKLFSNDLLKSSLSNLLQLFNMMKIEDESMNDDDVQLKEFLGCSGEQDVNSVENLISFSSESDEASSDESSDEAFLSSFDQTSGLTFEDEMGSLKCTLCRCSLPNCSSETFLTHCRSAEHCAKLKKRFLPEMELPQTLQKTDALPQAFEKQETELNKKQSKAVSRSKKNSNHNENSEAKLFKKGVENICLLPGNKIKCQLCNVIMPESKSFNGLVKNCWIHLQSKNHLKESQKVDSLKQKCESNLNKQNDGKNKPEQKTVLAKKKEKMSENLKAKPAKTKPTNLRAIKTDSNSFKNDKITNKKEYRPNAPDFSIFCLPCNLILKNAVEFEAHKNSKTHFNSKEMQHKCKLCKKFLYGSRDDIGVHYSKCAL